MERKTQSKDERESLVPGTLITLLFSEGRKVVIESVFEEVEAKGQAGVKHPARKFRDFVADNEIKT
jgi:hypothetical protein